MIKFIKNIGKSKKRLNYIRPFHNKALDIEEMKTEEQIIHKEPANELDINRCFQCDELKSSGGTLRCNRDKCKYDNKVNVK